MSRYLLVVFCAPGRRVVRTRPFVAESPEAARQVAVQAAQQWQHRARVARYRVTWTLSESDVVAGTRRLVAAGNLATSPRMREALE